MIKTDELKIGSWYYTPSKKLTVFSGDDLANKESFAFDLNPIPLEDKWLLRLGFINENGTWKMNVSDSVFYAWEAGILTLNFKKGGIEKFRFSNINNVHQIQNLLNAHAGNHLNIKEEAERYLDTLTDVN